MKSICSLFLICSLFFISCQNIENENVLDIAVSSEPPTLDVIVNTSLISRIIAVGNIYEKPFVLDGDGNIALELAKEYTLNEEDRKLSIAIRGNVFFHDNSKMYSEDVAASLNHWLDSYSTADTLVSGARFYIVDDDRIEIKSSSSLLFLPYLIASSPQSAIIMPKRIIDKLDEGELINEYIGTGPYMLNSWQSGDRIELVKYPNYTSYAEISNGIWGKKEANIDKLIYHFVPDSVTRRLGLESGQYDFINDVMSEDRDVFYRSDDINIIEGGESGLIALVFNKKEGLGTDPDFRKAISLAVDNDALLKACYGNYGYSVHTDYMEKEQLIWRVEDSNIYKGQNIELSKEYLDKSSYDGRKIRILTSNLSNLDKIAVAMASDLSKIGVETEIISVDWASMIEKRKNPSEWDIYISAFSRTVLPQMKSYLSPSFPGWIDPNEEGIGIMMEMNNARSIKEASLLWEKAQISFWDSVPIVALGHYITSYAAKSDVIGIINQDGFFFWNARRDDN